MVGFVLCQCDTALCDITKSLFVELHAFGKQSSSGMDFSLFLGRLEQILCPEDNLLLNSKGKNESEGKMFFTPTNLGEHRRTRRLAAVQRRHRTLHLRDSGKQTCGQEELEGKRVKLECLLGVVYPLQGLRQSLDQSGAVGKGLRGFR